MPIGNNLGMVAVRHGSASSRSDAAPWPHGSGRSVSLVVAACGKAVLVSRLRYVTGRLAGDCQGCCCIRLT